MEGHQQPQHYSWKSSWDAQHCTYKPLASSCTYKPPDIELILASCDWTFFMQLSWLLMSLHSCVTALSVHWMEFWEEIMPCVCACVSTVCVCVRHNIYIAML